MKSVSLYAFNSRHIFLFFLLVTFFNFLVYTGTDLISPFMPIVVKDMQAPDYHIANAFNLYLLGGVAFQWVIGSFSDYYGRRPLLLSGALIFALSLIAASFSDRILWFNLLRFIQGTAIGFILVIIYPLLQEIFSEKDAVRFMALLSNIALLSPLIGPLLGSMLVHYVSWRVIFFGIGICTLLVLAGWWRWMPETLGVARKDGTMVAAVPLSLSKSCLQYCRLWQECRFLCGTVALGLLSLPLISWIGMSPLLLISTLGYDQTTYALLQFPVFGGVITGTLLLNKLVFRYSLGKLFLLSLIPLTLGEAGLAFFFFFDAGLPFMVLFLTLYASGLGLGNSILYRLTLFAVSAGRSYAAAMLGMLSTGISVIGIAFLTWNNVASDSAGFASAIAIYPLLSIIPLIFFFLIPCKKERATVCG